MVLQFNPAFGWRTRLLKTTLEEAYVIIVMNINSVFANVVVVCKDFFAYLGKKFKSVNTSNVKGFDLNSRNTL